MKVTDEDKDWIGIHTSRTNGQLLRTIFREEANPVMIDARGKIKSLTYPITIGSGFKGGEVTPLFFIGASLGNIFGYLSRQMKKLLCAKQSIENSVGYITISPEFSNG